MKKKHLQSFKVLKSALLVSSLFLISLGAQSQTQVFLDQFNVSPLDVNYTITKVDDALSKVQLNSSTTPTHFQIYNNNAVDGDVTGTNKRAFMTRSLNDFSSPYMKKLNENGTVTWTFNSRHSKTSPAGMPHVNGVLEKGDNNYAQLMVLVSSNADLLSPLANGYAVSFTRDSLNKGIYSLVSFAGGLGATNNLTTLIASNINVISGSFWASVKVVYVSATNTWSLSLRDDASTTIGVDPMDVSVTPYTFIGSVVNSTYTSTDMTSFGFYANCGISRASNNAKALYDNFGVVVSPLLADNLTKANLAKITDVANGFIIEAENADVKIFDVTGKTLLNKQINGTEYFYGAKGVYVVNVQTENGKETIKQLIK